MFYFVDALCLANVQVACEQSSLTLNCSKGNKLVVLDANYGRLDNSTCITSGVIRSTDCSAATSLSVVQNRSVTVHKTCNQTSGTVSFASNTQSDIAEK